MTALKVFLITTLLCCLAACTPIDVFEKTVPVPEHKWQHGFKPSFTFNITDTAAPYKVYILLRHNNQYAYNNIWLNIHNKFPGDSIRTVSKELPLANKEGWLGSGMDDIFEHRISLLPSNENFYFPRSGEYTFFLEHIMRDNPLHHVMNVGLRVEKKVQ